MTEAAAPAKKTTPIDIRIFMAVITTAMAMSFFAGVALGPSPELIPTGTSVTPPSSPLEPPAASQTFPQEIKIHSKHRAKTKHAAEIGQTLPDLNEHHVNYQQPVLEDFGDGSGPQITQSTGSIMDTEDEHLPAGQHLLVDLGNVEAVFLNSEKRLADAIVNTIKEAGLTLLSYHCHSLLPAGVSCVGILLESHISFHTWPDEGVITLDLFTCGSNPLLPVVPTLERLFGIPRNKPNSDEKEDIISLWSHELRGFRSDKNLSEHKNKHLDNKSDLAQDILSPLLFGTKKQIISVESPYQRIDIWDYLPNVATPSYEDGLKHNLTEGDPRWLTSEVASWERSLYINGIFQSSASDAYVFHEALVQPVMFSHSNPKHVAVMGGGEGASIREILKHYSVESVTMIEMDEMLVNIAKEHLAHMSDCSDFEDLADSCFEDEKVTLIHADAVEWFKKNQNSLTNKFDVIILDAMEPKDAESVYLDSEFIDALYNSMSDDGVFAIHVGESFGVHDPRPDMGVTAPREKFMQILEAKDETAAMMVYDDAHVGYDDPHSFLAVCKSKDCKNRWYAQPFIVDAEVAERIKPTKSGEDALQLFDGTTQYAYQITSRGWETVYCRREPMPFECAYRVFDVNAEIFEMDDVNYEIKIDDIDGTQKKSIFAKVDIPKGSYIMPSDLAASLELHDDVIAGLDANTKMNEYGEATVIKNFLEYVEKYGSASSNEGSKHNYVEIGGSVFIRSSEDANEVNIGKWVPEHPSGKIPVWSPVYQRRALSLDLLLVATKDIKAGEEIVRASK